MHERETADAPVNQLTAEDHRWMLGQGLDLGSPDKHVFDEALTPAQRGSLFSACAGDAKSGNDAVFRLMESGRLGHDQDYRKITV
jgi:hypothetical protein